MGALEPSTTHQVPNETEKKTKWIDSSRSMVTIMLCLGMANAYTMRTNMSVAIVAMVNQTAIEKAKDPTSDECAVGGIVSNTTSHITEPAKDGEFLWSTTEQALILSSFFYGYVITQVPFGIFAKKYGAKIFLGGGMLVNSLFGLLVPAAAHYGGFYALIAVRLIQGLGEGPIVPCTHAMLAKWIPPKERSRAAAFVYSGAQFGTIVSMPISGLLSDVDLFGGWPLIFYFFGIISTVWCIAFFFIVYEDPSSHPRIDEKEKSKIIDSVYGEAGVTSPPIPWMSILLSGPFWAVLMAHIGQNYGYETLMTELPTFMKQILRFNIKENGMLSSVPYLSMWIMSMFFSTITDKVISSGKYSKTVIRKIANSFGHFGPAIALICASYSGCHPIITVVILSVGLGLNGAIYSGFKVNHLDLSPRFAGVLMAFTNFTANMAGLLAPLMAGRIVHGRPTQEAWREVFFLAAAVYIICNILYIVLGSSKIQEWDNLPIEEEKEKKTKTEIQETVA